MVRIRIFNPFQANGPSLYPLKTLENVFSGCRKRQLGRNGLIRTGEVIIFLSKP